MLWHVLQLALAAPFVILGGPAGVGGQALFAPVRHGPGHLMRRGHERWGWTPAPCEAPVQGPQGTGGAPDGWGRPTDGMGSAVAMFPGAPPEPLAAGEVLLGRPPPPGAAAVVIGPLAPGGPQLSPVRIVKLTPSTSAREAPGIWV